MTTPMTCAQAGALGGRLILERYGRAHFRRLRALAPPLPAAHFRAMARAGHAGQHAADPAGAERRARAGGEALLARRGVEWYRELGRRSQAKRRAEVT